MKTLSQAQTQQKKLVGEQKLGERGQAGSATATGQEPTPQLRTESQQKGVTREARACERPREMKVMEVQMVVKDFTVEINLSGEAEEQGTPLKREM